MPTSVHGDTKFVRYSIYLRVAYARMPIVLPITLLCALHCVATSECQLAASASSQRNGAIEFEVQQYNSQKKMCNKNISAKARLGLS